VSALLQMQPLLDSESPVSPQEIDSILSYVRPSERRVVSAHISNDMLVAVVERCSPSYTVRQVDYLSISELTIGAAQVSHILIEAIVRSPKFPYPHVLSPHELARARDEHRIYFLDFQCRFRRKCTAPCYSLEVRMERLRIKSTLILATFAFTVDSSVQGKFVAGISLNL
jgi:hypothetical protein